MPIPGTTSPRHLRSNVDAARLRLDDAQLSRLDALTPSGQRYAGGTGVRGGR